MFGDWDQKKRRQYLLLVGGVFIAVFMLLLFAGGVPTLSRLPETLLYSHILPGLISGYYLNQAIDDIMLSRSNTSRYTWIFLNFVTSVFTFFIFIVGGMLSVLPGFFYNLVLYLQRRRPKY